MTYTIPMPTCEDCNRESSSLIRCNDDTTWPVCDRMVCSECAAKPNHDPYQCVRVDGQFAKHPQHIAVPRELSETIELANALNNTAGPTVNAEVSERVLGEGIASPVECLAVAQDALASLLTLAGAEDRWAMCGVVEMALLVCEDREVRRLISSMLLIAEAMTAHCEDEIDALRDPQEALGEMKGHLTAIDTHGIAVEDCEGGIWHPSDDAAAEIAATDDPCAAAVKMCRTAPLRGRWSS